MIVRKFECGRSDEVKRGRMVSLSSSRSHPTLALLKPSPIINVASFLGQYFSH